MKGKHLRRCVMNKETRLHRYFFVLVLVACFLWVSPSGAQDYPKGTIQIVVPFAPGGSTDIFWRTIAEFLSKNLNANLAILNKPGAGGVVGVSSVVNSKPDGYTLAVGNSDTLDITPLFNPDMPFHPINDLTYVVKLSMFPQAIAVRTESPFKTLDELAAFAKANPKKLKAGTPGVGTSPYIAAYMFNDDAQVEVIPIAFGGGGEVVPNILGGHVDFAFISIPPIKAQVAAGKIRILALLAKNRHPLYPDIPTAAEKGFGKTIVETGIGLVGPKGLPPAVIKKWEEAVQLTLKDPKVIDAVEKFDFIIDYKTGEAYRKEIAEEFEFFKKLMANVGEKK
jgi:tripartite-type tricarboxylate transporter receptor subunit TctC